MTDAQNKILEVAGKMFFRFGIRSVSIDDICKELGMSKKTFYASFETKDDLVSSLLDMAVQRTSEKMAEVLNNRPLQEVASCFVNEHVQDSSDVRRVPQLVFDLQKYYPQLFDKYQMALFIVQRDSLCRYIKKNQDLGLIRQEIDAENLALILAKMHTDMVRDAARLEEDGYSAGQLIHTTFTIITRGVLTKLGYELVFGNN